MSYILAATGLQREAKLIARPGVKVIACGGHADFLRRRMRHQIEQHRPAGLLSVGIAGALAPTLRVGDVVIGHDVESMHRCDPAWASNILAQLQGSKTVGGGLPPPPDRTSEPVVIGTCRIIPVEKAISIREKAHLFSFTDGVAVDMESDTVSDLSWQYKLPFAVIRVISDTADQELPAAACIPLRRDGGVDLPRVLGSVARQPSQIPALVRTALDANKALKELLRRLDRLAGDGLLGLDLGELGLDVL